jgi:hypothetical protein
MVLTVGEWTTGVPDVAAMGAVVSSLTKIVLELSVNSEGTVNVGVI